MSRTQVLEGSLASNNIARREDTLTNPQTPPMEEVAPGGDLPYPEWRNEGRRTKVSYKLQKWGFLQEDENILCMCGSAQDPAHLLVLPHLDQPYTMTNIL